MARPRRPNEPSSYEPQPEIAPELRRRFDVIRAVLGERMTVSEAARELGMARVNMQTLVHRAEGALAAALEPRPSGPTPKPAAEKQLEARIAQLEKENAKLTKQLQAADDMMMAAGEIIRSLRGLSPENPRPRSKRTKPTGSDEDPEAARQAIFVRALESLRKAEAGARMARMLGIDVTTLKRWLERLSSGQPLRHRRGGVMREGPLVAEQRVRELVIDLHGLPGADSLAHSVDGVSRRRAALIKRDVLTEMERTRKAAGARVEITRAGVVRGFDAMHLADGFILGASDAHVPYRTSATRVSAYDARSVAEVLDEDFSIHGAPLVLREDRARCHTADLVLSVLQKHGVLLLQGPPYHAQYYGQLERQNLEHRRWCDWLDDVSQSDLDRMKTAFNDHWRRPTLDWRTAGECWSERSALDDDRDELHDEVEQRAERLRASLTPDLAMRLAIEQALTKRGYLRITRGRRVLCE